MGNLNKFYKENTSPAGVEIAFTLSDRFLDRDDNGEVVYNEDGSPKLAEFKIKTLKPSQFMDIASGVTQVNSRTGDITLGSLSGPSIDLIVECLVEPNLRDAQLQNSYGVTSVYGLIDEMFTPTEVQLLLSEVNNAHSGGKTMNQMVDILKNY